MAKRWLKWLPEPSESDLARLRALSGAGIDLGSLDQLAAMEWGNAGLRHLAKASSTILGNTVLSSAATERGYVKFRVLIFSNASAQHLAEPIQGSAMRHRLLAETLIAEYEEPEAFLVRERERVRTFAPDAVLINYDAHAFGLTSQLGSPERALETVAAASARLASIREAVKNAVGKSVVLQTIVSDPTKSRLHMDWGLAGSHSDLLRGLNNALGELARQNGDLILDVAGLAAQVGLENWQSRKYWVAAKYPFAPDAVPLYADHLCRLLAVLAGKSRRVLVLDLDNTLWGGIVGDDGKENLQLGSGSAAGEAHRDIQLMAKDLHERGIVLCISSKNDESIALDAFRTHPEMVLTEDDIAMFQINWSDKAANIKAMSDNLSLGLNSFVFLDDNPAERSRVRDALPEVAVPELPIDVSEWLPVFHSACYFETSSFSQEDAQRTAFYRANSLRAQKLDCFADHDTYLKSLAMEMDVRPFDAVGRARIAQLIAKSNQFNLTTKRRSESEISDIENDPGMFTYQIRLRDQFGDNGMISIVIAKATGSFLEIDTWLMSCRVLGRKIEEKVLDVIVSQASVAGFQSIIGTFLPSAKNAMVRDHYSALGFRLLEELADGMSQWILDVTTYKLKDPPILVLNK